jgi:hypothetical protein
MKLHALCRTGAALSRLFTGQVLRDAGTKQILKETGYNFFIRNLWD